MTPNEVLKEVEVYLLPRISVPSRINSIVLSSVNLAVQEIAVAAAGKAWDFARTRLNVDAGLVFHALPESVSGTPIGDVIEILGVDYVVTINGKDKVYPLDLLERPDLVDATKLQDRGDPTHWGEGFKDGKKILLIVPPPKRAGKIHIHFRAHRIPLVDMAQRVLIPPEYEIACRKKSTAYCLRTAEPQLYVQLIEEYRAAMPVADFRRRDQGEQVFNTEEPDYRYQ